MSFLALGSELSDSTAPRPTEDCAARTRCAGVCVVPRISGAVRSLRHWDFSQGSQAGCCRAASCRHIRGRPQPTERHISDSRWYGVLARIFVWTSTSHQSANLQLGQSGSCRPRRRRRRARAHEIPSAPARLPRTQVERSLSLTPSLHLSFREFNNRKRVKIHTPEACCNRYPYLTTLLPGRTKPTGPSQAFSSRWRHRVSTETQL